MSIKLSDQGAVAKLNKYFKNISPVGGNSFKLKLFTNDVDIDDTTLTASSFTEASGGGYEDIELTAADFTVSVVEGIAQAATPLQSFTFTGTLTGGVQVYGYYVVDADGVYIFADKPGDPYTPTVNGLFAVNVTYQLSKGTPVA